MADLSFAVRLTDRVTAPLKRVQSQIKAFNQSTVNSFKQIGVGSLAIWGTAKSIMSLVEPAEEMDRALKKAGLSGITSLDALRTEAKRFSSEYGTSALDFVNSASLVKNTLTSISAKDLPKATAAINLLSKATGDSMETSSAYIAQMLSNYKNVANKMGQLNFTKQALGVAAYAKQHLNVSTDQLKGLVEGTNNAGGNYGVDMGEQTIVLSMLSKSLGSGASSAYENFYKNLSKAGQELGMSFTDANGKMLAMPDILTKIQSKFGKNLVGNVKAQKALNAAFGDGDKVINVLSNNSDELNKHIKAIGGSGGFDLMKKMAEANIKPLDVLAARFMNIKESLGRAMLPVLLPVMNAVGGAIDKFGRWMDMFPNIAKWIGIITLAVIGLAAAAAVFAVISGVVALVMSPIAGIIIGIAAGIVFVIMLGMRLWRDFKLIFKDLANLWDKFTAALEDGFNEAVNWIVGKVNEFSSLWDNFSNALQDGINSAVIGMITAVNEFWENLKNTAQIQALIETFQFLWQTITVIWDAIGQSFSNTIDWISEKWGEFLAFFTDFSFIESFTKIGDALIESFSTAWKMIKNMGIGVINAIIEKLNYIPGVNIELIEYEPIEPTIKASTDPSNSPLTGTTVNSVEPGGLSKEIKNSKSQTVDNSQNINSVVFNVEKPMTPAQLQEWNYMYGG